MNPTAPLSGETLEQALTADRFDVVTPIVIVGLLRAAAQPGHVTMSLDGCGTWHDVPTSLITEARPIGRYKCGDHDHPVARVGLISHVEDEQATGDVARFLLDALAAASTRQAGPGGMHTASDEVTWQTTPTMGQASPAGIEGAARPLSGPCGPAGVYQCQHFFVRYNCHPLSEFGLYRPCYRMVQHCGCVYTA
jgi:hypothetical protein